jgi:competence protein ComEC
VRQVPRLTDLLDRQRGHLFPWLPVAYAAGIGTYFALDAEPTRVIWGTLAAVFALGVVLAATVLRHGVVLLALLAAIAGVGVAGLRTASVDEPVLAFRYYGPIEGRIVGIDRSQSDKPRLTLDRVVLRDVAPGRTPARVRVSLHGDQRWIVPEPGLTVILTGHLSPPEGPVEPGGFDFQRQAYFDRLGAVGYTRTPVLALRPAEEGRAGLFIYRTRMAITAAVLDGVPGRAGAFAAAITTGDRSAIDADTLEALRASNLAHLLAISGLHMGLLTAFVFAAVRLAIAAVPPLALRVSGKKIAAVVALAAGAVYLALSGGNVATERAFVMVAVVLTAVLFDARALTLRAVALAALIVLTLRPEALTEPGFQMSFAATIALIAVFSRLREVEASRIPRWTRPVFALVVSSAVAGLATAPIAASHFNQVPHYGLLANTLSVPLMGTVIMPAAVLAAVLAPFGLHGIGLAIMRPAIEWILLVAEWVAGMEGALSFVPAPQPVVIPVLTLGALWVILWQGRARLAGVVPVAAALLLWTQVDRPDVLVSPSGALVGVLTPDGRALSKARGDGFAAASWLENDGDPVDQEAAHARAGFAGEAGSLRFPLGPGSAVHLSGRGAASRLEAACAGARLVILAAEAAAPEDCAVIGAGTLAETGALAIYVEGDRLRTVSVRETVGRRPWNSQ